MSSRWVWAFALISIIQAAIVLGFEGYVFATFHLDVESTGNETHGDPTTTIPTFLALYIFAFVYQLVLVWDALRLKNTIQIIGLVGLNVGLLIYGAVQMDQLHDAVNILGAKGWLSNADLWHATKPYLIAIPCILGFTTICLGYVAYMLYKEFAWTIYKHISADLRMKRRYLTYQIYIALLKFDFFFTLGFTIQFVIIVGGRSTAEKWVTVAAIPVTVVIMVAAFLFCRRESLVGTIVVIVLYFAGLAYFCFKLYRMYEPRFKDPYVPARKELTTFAVLTIFLLLGTIIVACMCAHNYGQGLMPYLRSGSVKRSDRPDPKIFESGSGYQNPQPNYMGNGPYSTEMTSEPYGGKNSRPLAPTRMEID